MDIKHITSDSLRRLLSLTDKKEQLIQAVSDIENEIAKTLKGAATSAVEVAEAVTPFKPASKAGKRTGKAKSGGLKSRVLALLEAAGDEGIRVKDIASKLGTKASSISVWFSTTGKEITTKLEPGRYAKKGTAKAAAPAKEPSAQPAKKALRATAAKSRRRGRRGSWKRKSALKKVAKKPLKVAGAKPRTVRFKLAKPF